MVGDREGRIWKAVEKIERKMPCSVPSTVRRVAEHVLRNVEKEHLEADPELR